jgi:hypothetical protein
VSVPLIQHVDDLSFLPSLFPKVVCFLLGQTASLSQSSQISTFDHMSECQQQSQEISSPDTVSSTINSSQYDNGPQGATLLIEVSLALTILNYFNNEFAPSKHPQTI